MDYVKIMEQYLNLSDDCEERVVDAKARVSSISASAEDLYNFFQSQTDQEVYEKIIAGNTEIKEKLVSFILSLLYLCHDIGIDGDSIEAMLYSEIVKECNKKVNNPGPKITAL